MPNLSLKGALIEANLVVAPIKVNLGRFIVLQRATLLAPIVRSSLKSSIAEYNNSSVNLFKRCISSINKTSPSFNPRSKPTISLGLSIAVQSQSYILYSIRGLLKKQE